MSDTKESLLTADEWEVYEFLTEAWNHFVKLEILFIGDRTEFSEHINALKNIVMSRPVVKEVRDQGYPEDQL